MGSCWGVTWDWKVERVFVADLAGLSLSVCCMLVQSRHSPSPPQPHHPPISAIVPAQISQLYFQHATSVVSISQVCFILLLKCSASFWVLYFVLLYRLGYSVYIFIHTHIYIQIYTKNDSFIIVNQLESSWPAHTTKLHFPDIGNKGQRLKALCVKICSNIVIMVRIIFLLITCERFVIWCDNCCLCKPVDDLFKLLSCCWTVFLFVKNSGQIFVTVQRLWLDVRSRVPH